MGSLATLGAGGADPAAGGSPTIAFNTFASHASAAVTSSANLAGVQTLVAYCVYSSGSFTSFVDSSSNTWSVLSAESNDASAGMAVRAFICQNATVTGSHTFTLTAGTPTVFVVGMAGLAVSALDANPGIVNDTSSPYASNATGTLTQASEIVLTFIATNGSGGGTASHTLGGDFAAGDRLNQQTNASSFWTGSCGGKIVSATTTQTASWTETGAGTNRTLVAIYSFKAA